MKNIYIVLSHTGTLLSSVIRVFTFAKYGHVSICLEDDVSELYSFGRLDPYNMFIGGFVKESPDFGTFKRFKNTKVAIYRLVVEEETYDAIRAHLAEMYRHKEEYLYNTKGMFLAKLGIIIKRPKYYYCSEFVGEILTRFSVVDEHFFPKVIVPKAFAKIPAASTVYEGKLSAFSCRNPKRIRLDEEHPLHTPH